MLGCHGGGKWEHFAGTEHATRRCPRRQLIDCPDVVQIFALRRDVEGLVGLDRRRRITGAAADALAVVDDAVHWKSEEDRKDAERERKR